uniref:Uncharacterized protein n=1 Tax=Chromera velia CCMP2878 TaxID=1169474 RepID=A0A0G4I6F0_9ALVE|mmetsp:Transcript_35980/g.70793  ORF Transcript_35980/g.70793 Transcript_35980/m.70793 type:complete len:807 (-) Transcript_35980:674-3094(-)|eukprot:Cvel_11397.t1-p1 / transcript=Cvel_11397.t1 / gene=Cvel_11397 / organism=Chromera_velia_CCMP2878 / gene_product=hypothetical protein / transcript_product=hypothetical protein / location=Cvel_scaffold715:34617-43668(+) / protein_length=806 / sequence_SO=supercontig / SO=protein_coding / is_pseudo=false
MGEKFDNSQDPFIPTKDPRVPIAPVLPPPPPFIPTPGGQLVWNPAFAPQVYPPPFQTPNGPLAHPLAAAVANMVKQELETEDYDDVELHPLEMRPPPEGMKIQRAVPKYKKMFVSTKRSKMYEDAMERSKLDDLWRAPCEQNLRALEGAKDKILSFFPERNYIAPRMTCRTMRDMIDKNPNFNPEFPTNETFIPGFLQYATPEILKWLSSDRVLCPPERFVYIAGYLGNPNLLKAQEEDEDEDMIPNAFEGEGEEGASAKVAPAHKRHELPESADEFDIDLEADVKELPMNVQRIRRLTNLISFCKGAISGEQAELLKKYLPRLPREICRNEIMEALGVKALEAQASVEILKLLIAHGWEGIRKRHLPLLSKTARNDIGLRFTQWSDAKLLEEIRSPDGGRIHPRTTKAMFFALRGDIEAIIRSGFEEAANDPTICLLISEAFLVSNFDMLAIEFIKSEEGKAFRRQGGATYMQTMQEQCHSLMQCAVRMGKMNFLTWMRGQKAYSQMGHAPPFPWCREFVKTAITAKNADMLRFACGGTEATENPPTFCKFEMRVLAAKVGDVPCLEWLRDRTGSMDKWDATVCKTAVENESWAALKWLRTQTPPAPWKIAWSLSHDPIPQREYDTEVIKVATRWQDAHPPPPPYPLHSYLSKHIIENITSRNSLFACRRALDSRNWIFFTWLVNLGGSTMGDLCKSKLTSSMIDTIVQNWINVLYEKASTNSVELLTRAFECGQADKVLGEIYREMKGLVDCLIWVKRGALQIPIQKEHLKFLGRLADALEEAGVEGASFTHISLKGIEDIPKK